MRGSDDEEVKRREEGRREKREGRREKGEEGWENERVREYMGFMYIGCRLPSNSIPKPSVKVSQAILYK